MTYPYPRIMNQIESTQWAITKPALEAIWKIASREYTAADYEIFHQASKDARMAIVSDIGEPMGESASAFVRGDTGILLLDGPIIPRADSFSAASGLVSLDTLTAEFKAFEDDESIKRIMLLVDSPGGDVTGVSDFADLVKASEKSTVAYVYGMAASAAYWIATAADTVISTKTGIVGSIGVMSAIKKDDDDVEIIISDQSPLKNADPETDAGRAAIQEMVNDLADVFVEDVAVNMGVKKRKVLSDFGRGSVVVAARALSAGMINQISTLDTLLSSFESTIPARAGNQPGGLQMDSLKELLAAHPNCAREVEEIKTKARAEGEAIATQKIAVCTPYLAKDSAYGEFGRKAALNVLEGKASTDMLLMVATMLDAQAEEKRSAQAQEESEEVGATPATAPESVGQTLAEGELSAKAEAAMIASERKRLGIRTEA